MTLSGVSSAFNGNSVYSDYINIALNTLLAAGIERFWA